MAQTRNRITIKSPAHKLAHRRLTVREVAKRLGNVTVGLPVRRDLDGALVPATTIKPKERSCSPAKGVV